MLRVAGSSAASRLSGLRSIRSHHADSCNCAAVATSVTDAVRSTVVSIPTSMPSSKNDTKVAPWKIQERQRLRASAAAPSPSLLHQHFSSQQQQQQQQQRRCYSSSSPFMAPTTDNDAVSSSSPSSQPPSVEETLDKLFQEQGAADAASSAAAPDAASWFSTGAADAAEATLTTTTGWEPTWYYLSDQAILAVQNFHELTGIEYGWSIVGVTVIMRLALFPLMVQSQKTTSRMAHLQPELQQMKARYEAIGTPSRQDQLQFSKSMQNLFAKYQVKPLRAFAAPLMQFPLFMGMFFGLRKMPKIYVDELSTGGMFWFPDLTVPDPLYILPLTAAGSFLLLIELGKEQMMAQNPAQGQLFVNVFRFLSITMIPVCVSFESAMLCYWSANNVLTIGQTAILKSKPGKKFFGIWDPPKPVPGMEAESLTDAATKLMKKVQGEPTTEKQKIEQHNRQVEAKKKAKAFQMLRRKKA